MYKNTIEIHFEELIKSPGQKYFNSDSISNMKVFSTGIEIIFQEIDKSYLGFLIRELPGWYCTTILEIKVASQTVETDYCQAQVHNNHMGHHPPTHPTYNF